MEQDNGADQHFGQLREQALMRIRRGSAPTSETPVEDITRVVEELQIHQIELELQNEALRDAQQELSLSRDRYLELYHHSPVGYAITNAVGIVLHANETLGDMLQLDIAAILNRPLTEFMAAPDSVQFLSRYRAFFKNPTQKRLEVCLKKSDDRPIEVRLMGRRMNASGALASDKALAGQLMLSISDITDRKAAQRAIMRAKREWEQTFDAATDLIVIVDHQQVIKRVNRAFADRIGKPPRECIGLNCDESLCGSGADAAAHRRYRGMVQGEAAVQMEAHIEALAGDFIVSATPFTPHDNLPPWRILVFHDVTERKRAEREVRKTRNLESIGMLAGGIAHDFNNILVSIIGNIELAQMQDGDLQKITHFLDRALTASELAKALASRLLTFSQGGTPRPSPTDLRGLITDTVEISVNDTKIHTEVTFAEDLRPVMADDIQLKNVLQNVLLNAAEAMPQGGRIIIEARNLDIVNRDGLSMEPGHYIVIRVRDTGRGIDPDDLERVFDPYFTTKSMGAEKGMGLGLSIAYSIVKQHGGKVTINSTVSRGTVVNLFLPAMYNGLRAPLNSPSSPTAAAVELPKFLIMEDESALWDMMDQLLSGLNCRADFAANGPEALALFRHAQQTGQPYTALLLDLTIRGSDEGGREVVQKILEIDPSARAVAFSGYTNDPVFSDHRHYGFIDTLTKPFKLAELRELIQRLIPPQ
ncbi:MAG: ATP-binding protein [Desulfosarcinaceae bacterium]|nr:ATP-binding protein [Desulfosarcinaceae bacterium]